MIFLKCISQSKKILLVLAWILFLGSCAGNSSSGDEASQTNSPMQNMTKEESQVNDANDLAEGDGTNMEAASPKPIEKDETMPDQPINSMDDLFKTTDAEWNDSETYQNAVAAYSRVIGKNTVDYLHEKYTGGVGKPRMSVAYINEDDIPEITLCFENIHGRLRMHG